MTVAEAMRTMRRQAGLSQAEVGALLGVSPQFVSQIEAGRKRLSEARLRRLPDSMRSSVVLAAIVEYDQAIKDLRRMLPW